MIGHAPRVVVSQRHHIEVPAARVVIHRKSWQPGPKPIFPVFFIPSSIDPLTVRQPTGPPEIFITQSGLVSRLGQTERGFLYARGIPCGG